MSKHQVTIVDIARELGISKSTVSRALANHPNVHPQTHTRVWEAAKFHEYQPNLLAKSLIQRKTHHLGVVIPDIEKPFFASIVSGIQHVANRSGYRIIITQSNESPEEEVANIQALVLSRVDGLLVCHTRETTHFDHMHQIYRKGFPVTGFARICPGLNVPNVVENDVQGAYLMVRHLLEGGARHIGLLSGPKNLTACRLREKGYRKALQEAGIRVNPRWIVNTRFMKEDIAKAVDHWMGLPHPPDGLFAIYDAGAVALIRHLKAQGRRIPDDLQIAGFGNDPVAELMEPSLTTYAQFPFKIGEMACQQMLDLLAGVKTAPKEIVVTGKLLKRQSTLGPV
ncbi:MAG TPA: LacI family DNA-binding transcriptional regulator [Chitinophagaceae bacterium]|nr:LacI family DNA-binding transcriptional regulator [Chitinophagaceae bacterium]